MGHRPYWLLFNLITNRIYVLCRAPCNLWIYVTRRMSNEVAGAETDTSLREPLSTCFWDVLLDISDFKRK